MRPALPLRGTLRRVAVLVAAMAFGGLSCVSDSTGPRSGMRVADRVAFAVRFPGPLREVASGAGRVVAFTSVRVQLSREDGSIAFDRTVPFADTAQELRLDLNVPLSSAAPPEGEPLALRLWYLNAANDTVFRGGPEVVLAVGRGEAPPPPVVIPLVYTGPGASATSVRLTPDTITVVAGQPFTFTAAAVNAQQAAVPNAPVVFASLDTTRARITAPTSGSGTTAPTRGIARIRVELASGAGADTSILVILPRPASLTITAGNAQTGPAGSALADSIRVRLLASDGLPIAGARVAVRALTGGGAVSSDSLTTDANGLAAFRWTLGSSVGAQTAEASIAGVPVATVSATATAVVSTFRALQIVAEPPDGVSAGDTLTPPIIVQVVDSAGAVISTAEDLITLSIASGPAGATVAGTTARQAVTGLAPFNGWRVQGPVGVYRFAVSAPGAIPDTTAAIQVNAGAPTLLELVSGDGQSAFTDETLPLAIRVRARDAFANPVPGVGLTFAVTAGGGTLTGATPTTDAAGIAGPTAWRLGASAGPQTLTASVTGRPSVPSVLVTATANARPPAVVLGIQGTNVVGVGRVGTLVARLLQPAPAGGLVVSFANAQPTLLTIAAPSSVTIAAGDTLGTIEMSGVAEGTSRVIATASGFIPDTLDVPVTLNLISLPTTLSVPLNQTQSLPVQLSTPAPAGGVRVVVATANPAIARPVTDTVTVAAGATLVNASVLGTGLGTTILTASNANYASDSSSVTVTAGVDIVPTTFALNASFGTPMVVRLVSAGAPIAAPAGGITIGLSAVTPTCVAVPATVSIDAGNTSVSVPVTYGGAGAPCSSLIRATGPAGFASDSATANVAATPAIVVATTVSLGAGLQRGISATLGASNHGGTTVRVTSLDSTKVLVSGATNTVGRGSVDVPVTVGVASLTFVAQATEGWTADSVRVTLSAPGFTPDTLIVAITLPVFELTAVATPVTTASPDDPFHVTIGSPATPTGNTITLVDEVRAGGPGFTARIVNDSPTTGRFVQTSGLTDTAVVTIAPLLTTSPTTVAGGGVAFRPTAPGIAVLRGIIGGARAIPTSIRNVTVTQPTFNALTATTVGAGLQRAATLGLTAATPDTLVVTLRFDRLGVAKISPDAATIGGDSLVVTLLPGASSRSIVISGVEGVLADSVTLTASAPGYASRTALIRVFQAVFTLTSAPTTATPLAADDPLWVSVGTPSSPTATVITTADARRAGGTPFAATIVSENTAVAQMAQTSGVVDTARVAIAPGATTSPTTVASGGAAVRFVAPGTAVVRAAIPGLRALATAAATVTVVQPSVSALTAVIVGSGLQAPGTVTMSNAIPDSAIRVTLRPDRLGVILLAPNTTTVGSDSLVVTIPANATSASFVVQALDGIVADSVTLTASAPGYTSRTANTRVFRPLLGISGLAGTGTTFSLDDPFLVQVYTPTNATANTIFSFDEVRAGGTPIVATVSSSAPSVGRLVTSATSAGSVTVTIPVGSNTSASTVATGGVAFQPLTTGSTVITATAPNTRPIPTASTNPATVTVSIAAPDITLPATTVGAGLQQAVTGTLTASTHGGTTVILRSTNPAILKLARVATDTAVDSLVIPVANGVASFSYLVVGMEGQTGVPSVQARAVGFTDGSAAVTVVAPALQLSGVLTTQTAGGTDDPFVVVAGVPNSLFTALQTVQAVRAGAAGVTVTVTSSSPTAGLLVRNGVPSASATVRIAGAATQTANGGVDGIFFRPTSATGSPTTVSATAPGFVIISSSSVSVTVNP
jgi:hypothetical protein